MEEPRITKLPPPDHLRRVPTGAVQFGEDWPGLFIRGDDAIALMFNIRTLEKFVPESHNMIEFDGLRRIAEIVERDVVVSRAGHSWTDAADN